MDWRWLHFILLWISLTRCSGDTNLPPVFSHDMNNLLLSEGTPVGTVVYTLEGQDPEELPVKYGLVGTDKFQVNPETGEVTLVQPLDRELEDTLKFLVSIEDQVPGSTNNLVQEPVTVIVLDENDNAPIFKNSPYEVDIPEDEAVGSTVLQDIMVEDKDSVGDNLEVTCVPADQWPDACEIFELMSDHSSSSQYTGALVLRRPLDYNEKQFYRFQLSASDGTQNSTAHVDVKVVDVQNTPPMFSGALNGALSEDAPVGTLALTVKAKDGDRAHPRNVIVELVNNPHDFFLLDSVSGELKTAKPLDREALLDPSSPLNLTVRATELVDGVPVISNLTSSIAAVTITIKDVNDEPPKFNRKEYFVEIPESLALLTPLPNLDMLVTDKDVGINSVFGLRLSDKQGAFIVEPATAAGTATVTLRLNSTLDYEDPNQRKFIVQVIAEELHTSPRLSSVASLTVSVLDVNDNAPHFPQQVYRGSISEDAKEGDVVLTVTATDRDSGRFGTEGLVYQLYGNGASLFTVDNRTGVVSVAYCSTPGSAPCLDFDTRKDYFLHYKAIDDDGAGQTTVVSVHISLLDANDNPPVFETQVYKASIDEDANKFEPELQVQARDIDVTSELRYSIVETDTPFWIDALTGKLAVKPDASVQMETDDNHIVLTILATDGVHNATCKVEITIRDVNNHAPAFETDHYVGEIREDAPIGTEVVQVRASDMDTGINSEIRYAIQKGAFDSFVIDNITGVVTVSAKHDYDKRNRYQIQITASDLGMPSLTSTTELVVHVLNVNDKLPFFTPTIQRAEVSADAELSTIVHNLVAVDPDIKEIEQLYFKLSQSKQITAVDKNGKEVSEEGIFNSWFSITPNGSVLVSQKLDRNRAAVLTLPVTVQDTSAPTEQSADGELIITMVDVNRYSPQFSQREYTEHIAEEQPVGSILNTYVATDKETPISAIVIQPPNPYFTIDNVTGVVKTAQRIDYEKIQLITFTLVAYDSGVPQRSTSAPVQVLVTNVNDEEPKFAAASYEASLLENSPAGTLVVKVEATDADLDEYGTIRYSLTGEKSNLFTIDPSSGEVRVAEGATIDREENSAIYLRVAATDAYGQKTSRTTTVPLHIKILDANDNVPVFSQRVYKSTIAENLRVDPPAAILQVLADDKDEGVFGEVRYTIVEQSEPGTFRVDETTGIIYPTKPVNGSTTYQLTVSASDAGGRQGETARIDINVLSVNKHSPEFLLPPPHLTTVEIDEEAAQADFLILTVKATDADQGENGRISYYLKVDNRNVGETNEFVINRDTGELRTNTFLDRELTDSYQLVLVATDNGTPAKFESLHFLTIKLRDSNDNIPRFGKQHYEYNILENQPAGVIVGSVKATDRDSGEHGKVYYHILEGNSEGAFTLDRTQGLLRANISFDRETQSEYNLIVYASNNPILEHAAAILNSVEKQENGTEVEGGEMGVAYVKVKVLDENDNAPKFESQIYYAGVKHTARINSAILPVVATDGDLDQNGTLTYMVASSHLYKFGGAQSSGSVVPSPFNISQDGILMTAGYMSEYNQDRFVLDIIAQEIAPPHRQAKAQVYVWVIDRSALIRLVVSRGCGEVSRVWSALRRDAHIHLVPAAAASLNTVTNGVKDDWCELHVHAVDPVQLRVLPVEQVLEDIDSQYDSLKQTFYELGVETLVAYDNTAKMVDSFDPALAALIALLIVLFTGIVTFVVVCACLKHWVVPPPSLQSSKCESLSRRRILEELSSTENPLWVRQVLRPYEEQELTMHVFANAEDGCTNPPQADNTYATIQGSRTAERFGDYATLGGRESPSAMEAALGFQGSTFKPPSADTPEPPPRPNAGMNQT